MNNKITFSWNLLRYVYGLVILLAGLDKMAGTNFVDWSEYINIQAISMLPIPMSVTTFIFIGGILETFVGLLILTKYQRVGGYLAAVWLFIVSADLLYFGNIDAAIRNIMFASGALALSNFTDIARLTIGDKYTHRSQAEPVIS